MSKRPFVIFGIFAVICLVALPFWALAKEGSSDASPEGSVPASDQQGLELFQINCGACHTLAAAGTDGSRRAGPGPAARRRGEERRHGEREPDLVLQRDQPRAGGRMPKGILQGAQAKAVAQFVADNVQYIPGP